MAALLLACASAAVLRTAAAPQKVPKSATKPGAPPNPSRRIGDLRDEELAYLIGALEPDRPLPAPGQDDGLPHRNREGPGKDDAGMDAALKYAGEVLQYDDIDDGVARAADEQKYNTDDMEAALEYVDAVLEENFGDEETGNELRANFGNETEEDALWRRTDDDDLADLADELVDELGLRKDLDDPNDLPSRRSANPNELRTLAPTERDLDSDEDGDGDDDLDDVDLEGLLRGYLDDDDLDDDADDLDDVDVEKLLRGYEDLDEDDYTRLALHLDEPLGLHYIFLSAWGFERTRSFVSVYHTELTFCPVSRFTRAQQVYFNSKLPKRAARSDAHTRQGSSLQAWQQKRHGLPLRLKPKLWRRLSVECSYLGFGGSPKDVPGSGQFTYYAPLASEKGGIKATLSDPNKYFYGAATFDAFAVKEALTSCHDQWRGVDYSFSTHNCNYHTAVALKCALGLEMGSPGRSLGLSLLKPVFDDACSCRKRSAPWNKRWDTLTDLAAGWNEA